MPGFWDDTCHVANEPVSKNNKSSLIPYYNAFPLKDWNPYGINLIAHEAGTGTFKQSVSMHFLPDRPDAYFQMLEYIDPLKGRPRMVKITMCRYQDNPGRFKVAHWARDTSGSWSTWNNYVTPEMVTVERIDLHCSIEVGKIT
jgi:hypothetical protein